ncbi:DUF192 domain-containing protein [Vampirovibrio chlorellavorus]|uniref:DUF192 domain-containing protein n=1 Tax=Vampirovibrio chlorellavorus TaxID=758823 RepID=UPI0026F147A6|nr:DUF192 domain-containing protein [Vampirovibrio chlorellavorus]
MVVLPLFSRQAGLTKPLIGLLAVLIGVPWVSNTIWAQDAMPQTGLPLTQVKMGGRQYLLEVASTPQQAQTGLMYRTSLPVNGGMLFRFQETRPVAFWMKNTLIPLDMVFIQAGRVVHIAHQAQPCQQEPCPIYSSQKPVDMVIELPGGTARKHHIQAGATVRLRPLAQAVPAPMASSVSKQ